MRRFVLSLVLFAACASTKAGSQKATYVSDPSKAPQDASVVVCENELPTGSFIAETKCRRVEDQDADRRAAQDMLRDAQIHNVPPSSH